MRIALFFILLLVTKSSWSSTVLYINTLSPSLPFQMRIENTPFVSFKIDNHDGKQLITDTASGTQVFSRSSSTYAIQFSETITDRLMFGAQLSGLDTFWFFPFRLNFTAQYDLLKFSDFKVSMAAMAGSIVHPFSRYGYGVMGSYQANDKYNFFLSAQHFRESEKLYKDAQMQREVDNGYLRIEADISYDLLLAGAELKNIYGLSEDASIVLQLGQQIPRSVKLIDRDKDSLEYSIDKGNWYSIEIRVNE